MYILEENWNFRVWTSRKLIFLVSKKKKCLFSYDSKVQLSQISPLTTRRNFTEQSAHCALAAWLVSRLSRPRGTQVFESHSLLCWQHNHYYWAEINMSHQPDDVKGTRFASWDLVLDRIWWNVVAFPNIHHPRALTTAGGSWIYVPLRTDLDQDFPTMRPHTMVVGRWLENRAGICTKR